MSWFESHLRERFALDNSMFVVKGSEPLNPAMEKAGGLGPKGNHLPLLSGDWTPNGVKIEKIDVSRWEGSAKFCVVLHNILTKEECRQLTAFSEQRGYEKPTPSDIRNYEFLNWNDPYFMEQLWQRVCKATSEKDKEVHHEMTHIPFLNDRCCQRNGAKPFQAVGLNESIRFLRYDTGSYFAPHVDGSYVRSSEAGIDRYGEQSFLTFQLYLNDDFKGGATRLISEYDAYHEARAAQMGNGGADGGRYGHSVQPRPGSVLLFQHDCCHEGTKVLAGRKYAIRSDVMYSTAGPDMTYAARPLLARHFDDLY